MAKKQPKQKKPKVRYVDDGSTLYDMSGVSRRPVGQMLPPMGRRPEKPQPRTRAGKIWRTYWEAVKTMFPVMLTFLGAIAVLFFIMWVILGFFA